MSVIFGALVLTAGATYLYKTSDIKFIRNHNDKVKFENKFNTVMKSVFSKTENKIDQPFEILKYIPKEYGCDVVISKPYGLDISDFHKSIAALESAFNSEIIAELAESKRCIYARIHNKDLDIAEDIEIRMKWYKTMLASKDFRNHNGETFYIKKLVKNDKYGWDIKLEIPLGLDKNAILNNLSIINTTFKCNLYEVYKDEIDNQLNMKIIERPIPDNYKFSPVEANKRKFYAGMKYDYEPVLIDFTTISHIIVTGTTNTGKSYSIMNGITNTLCNDPDNVELYFIQLSDKKDFRVFYKTKPCKYYAEDTEDAKRLVLHLLKEKGRINKRYRSVKGKYINDFEEWEKVTGKSIKTKLLIIDEYTSLLPSNIAPGEKEKRKMILEGILKLLTEGRSADIHVILGIQRPDKDSLNPYMKSLLAGIIGFYQPNDATSLVVTGTTELTQLKKQREAIVVHEGKDVIKSLYLTKDMIEKLLKQNGVWDDNHERLNLNKDGNIEEIEAKTTEISKENPKIEEKTDKNNENKDKKGDSQSLTRQEKQNKRRKNYFECKEGA